MMFVADARRGRVESHFGLALTAEPEGPNNISNAIIPAKRLAQPDKVVLPFWEYGSSF